MAALFVNDSPAAAVTTKSVPSGSALPASAGKVALAAAANPATKANFLIFRSLSHQRAPLHGAQNTPDCKFICGYHITVPPFAASLFHEQVIERHLAVNDAGMF